MGRAALRAGQLLRICGGRFAIAQKLPENRWQLRNLETGEWSCYSRTDLLGAFASGDLTFEIEIQGSPSIDEQLARALDRDLRTYPEHLVAIAESRQKYLREIDYRQPISMTKQSLHEVIVDVSRQTEDPHPPSGSTLHRIYRLWVQSGRDIRALIPRIAARGNHRRRMTPEVAQIIEDNINKLYLRPERSDCSRVYAAVKDQIQRDNQFRGDTKKLTIPSLRSIHRAIAKRSPYDVMAKRYGKRIADNAFRCTGAGPITAHPLERVQIDHTPADCIVVDEKTSLPLGRPTITTLLDEHTQCVLGIHIGFDPPSTLAVMNALKNAILPKEYVASEFPTIKNNWPCFGVPWIIVCDNGKEFLGRHFQRACLSLGCDIQYTKPKVPYYKGAIERFQRSLNEQNLHPARGTTLARYMDLASDYDPRKNAVITMHTLREELHRWVIDVYHQQVHGHASVTPIDAWSRGTDGIPIPMPPSAKELEVILGRIGSGRVHHYGIQNELLHYNSDALGSLRREFGLKLRLEFIWSEDDLGYINVIHPTFGTHIQVPATRYTYASGLTLFQHKTIEAFKRKNMPGRTDEAASITAQKMIADALSSKVSRRSMKITKAEARQMFDGVSRSPVDIYATQNLNYSAGFSPPLIGENDPDSDRTNEELTTFETESFAVTQSPSIRRHA
jgi:putative transposase